MIYKFTKYTSGRGDIVGYIKEIPESAVFYNVYSGLSESWYIGIPYDDFCNPLEIDWRGKDCGNSKVIYLKEYVFIYLDGIISYGWPDVGKEIFEGIFNDYFNTIYFYEYDSRPIKRQYVSFENLDCEYGSYYFPISNMDTYQEPKYERGAMKNAYKLKGLTLDGMLEVISVYLEEGSNFTSIKRTSIDSDWDFMPRSYNTKDWKIEISNDGGMYWSMFDEAMILLGGN